MRRCYRDVGAEGGMDGTPGERSSTTSVTASGTMVDGNGK